MPTEITLYSIHDGSLENDDTAVYSQVHDAPLASYLTDMWNLFHVGQKKSPAHPYEIYRGFIFFDTTSIPENAIILNAKLYIKVDEYWGIQQFNIVIRASAENYPHDDVELGDYLYTHYQGNYGSINTSEIHLDWPNYSCITLTSYEAIKCGAVTKIMLISENDINSQAPIDLYEMYESVGIYGVLKGENYLPYLVIEYETEVVTTEAAEVPDPVANSSYEFADGNGTITSAVNATERGFEVKHEYSGNLYGVIVHEIAGFEGDTALNGTVWEGTLIKIEHEHGDFAQGVFTLELGRWPAQFYDKLFAGESYTYRAYAVISDVTYYGEWVAFSLGNFPAGVPVGGDDISAGNPVVSIVPIEPIEPPIVPIEPEEEFPELELPEFELPEFEYPEFPPYNGSWLGQFYYRKAYTKKDLDDLRRRCRVFQDNSVEYALVLNHNAAVLQQFLNMMTEYLDADEYNTFKAVIPTQHLNELAREPLDVMDFKEIINNFIRNSIDNANNVNNNFQLIRSGLSNYAYTEDEGFKDIKITTKEVDDNNPDVDRLKKVIDKLNLEMSGNYETINHNLHVLRSILS